MFTTDTPLPQTNSAPRSFTYVNAGNSFLSSSIKIIIYVFKEDKSVKYSKHKHPGTCCQINLEAALASLTTACCDGVNDNMIAAVLVECSKTVLPDGAIVVWNVREPVARTSSTIDCFLARMVGASSVSTTNAAKAIIVILTATSILTCSKRPMPSCPTFGRR